MAIIQEVNALYQQINWGVIGAIAFVVVLLASLAFHSSIKRR